MTPILIILLLVAGVVIGFFVGRSTKKEPEALTTKERRKLEALEELRLNLIGSAAEHATLGDNYAVIALEQLRSKELS